LHDRGAVGPVAVVLLEPGCQSTPDVVQCRNQVGLRHSSRSLPWKLSTWPFCIGRSGWMCTGTSFQSSAQPIMRREVNSGPLSERRFSGRPRSAITRSRTRVKRPLPRLVSASSAKALARVRIDHAQDAHHPRGRWRPSTMKSIAHSWFGPVMCAALIMVLSYLVMCRQPVSRPAATVDCISARAVKAPTRPLLCAVEHGANKGPIRVPYRFLAIPRACFG
jgi:hypothetical protein